MHLSSVLGPIAFFIFVNYIDTVICSHIQKFADDCKLYRSVPIAGDIDILARYKQCMTMAHRLANSFNVKKCKVLLIGHKNAYCDFCMNCEGVQSVLDYYCVKCLDAFQTFC